MKLIDKTGILTLCAITLLALCATVVADDSARQWADTIIEDAGLTGGVIVYLGNNIERAAALNVSDKYIVQCLVNQKKDNELQKIRSAKGSGHLSFMAWKDGRLPFANNMINILIKDSKDSIPTAEIDRVLAPRGIFIDSTKNKDRYIKPVPKDIDDWTHFLHGPDNNAVANDTQVGSPQRVQWQGGPKWSRSHEKMSGIVAMVSAQGKIFYIIDEGPTVSIQMPPDWRLVCRDAFNGVVLWKRKIEAWHPHRWPLKSGPHHLSRRLTAVGNRVYVTLGILDPVVQIDADTGKTLRTYKGTEGAEEILFTDNTLYLQVPADPSVDEYVPGTENCWSEADRARVVGEWSNTRKSYLVAIEPDSGKVKWSHTGPVARLSLTVGNKNTYYYDGKALIAVDRANGQNKWSNTDIGELKKIPLSKPVTVVAYQDKVLYRDHRKLFIIDAKTGKTQNTCSTSESGHFSSQDILIIDNIFWSGGKTSEQFIGVDLDKGEPVRKFSPAKMKWFHPRCYRSKATTKYLLTSRTGLELVDLEKEEVQINNWTRGTCLYGIMPANGLIYAPPHSCACMMESLTSGFMALDSNDSNEVTPIADKKRLTTGPAYGLPVKQPVETPAPDWPTYRHDIMRSGSTSASVPEKLKEAWSVDVGGKLTSLVASEGIILVAQKDNHRVVAMDEESGKKLWQFVAGGRVDSPPTIYRGMVFFGSADGYVYALRVSDGELVWKFLAATSSRQIVSYGQLESAWPVHGSVLIMNDHLYAVAGRMAFLDGGLSLYKLDPDTGKILAKNIMNELDPQTKQHLQKNQTGDWGLTLPTANTDILSGNGKQFFMLSQPFTSDCKRTRIKPNDNAQIQQGADIHLFSPVGLLDDNWHHRSYWIYGLTSHYAWRSWMEAGKYAPSGRILSFDNDHVYGFGRKPQFLSQAPVMEYRLYKAAKAIDPERINSVKKNETAFSKEAPRSRQVIQTGWKSRGELMTAEEATALTYQWSKNDPDYQVRAMAVTKNALLTAGIPDYVNEVSFWEQLNQKSANNTGLIKQQEAWEGKHGGYFRIVSKSDGNQKASYKLEAPPVFDGLITARNRIYISLMNGKVVCFQKK